ncbi:MAG: YqgE/AlgH family protein [Acidimicrobiales bacterium]
MTPPRKGRLLVATPKLDDPNFFRTVVLLLAHDEDGSLGVVINRPGDTPVAEVVPTWAFHASPPGLLFEGGPVHLNAAICVGRHDAPQRGDAPVSGLDPEDEFDVEGYSPLVGGLGTVDLHRDPDDIAVALLGLRVFKGYAGWGGGQLEEEIETGAWFVVEGAAEDVLTEDPSGLWELVLRRQGGWMSVISRHPLDPSLN